MSTIASKGVTEDQWIAMGHWKKLPLWLPNQASVWTHPHNPAQQVLVTFRSRTGRLVQTQVLDAGGNYIGDETFVSSDFIGIIKVKDEERLFESF